MFFDIQFWQSLVSTFFGAILGVLGALLLNDWQEGRTEKKIKEKILGGIKRELKENKKELLEWKEKIEESGGKSEWLLPYYRTETWRAFSDGGELEWIKDPDLLNELSEAYSAINHFSYYCEKWFEFYQVVYAEEHISRNELKERYDKSIKVGIEHALVAINNVLELN